MKSKAQQLALLEAQITGFCIGRLGHNLQYLLDNAAVTAEEWAELLDSYELWELDAKEKANISAWLKEKEAKS